MLDLYGLIGYPLGHSFSKDYFEKKFKNENIKGEFKNFEIDSLSNFKSIIEKNTSLRGLCVTIPYKESIIKYLSHISKEAKEIGAVNSIKIDRDINGNILTTGYNTDVYGFEYSLNAFIPDLKENKYKALILGTGGASKAVKFVLNKLNIEFLEVSRYPNDQQISYQETIKYINEFRIIINCTPLGMFPNVDTFPPICYDELGEQHYLYDLVYNPINTSFLEKGNLMGANTKNGLEMLYLQAERSYYIWNNYSKNNS